MKILVVDDEYMFCRNIKEYLVRLGHEVMVTTNGEHALDLLREERPDIMTLDMRMPGINGYDVLEIARKNENPVKIIIVSALAEPEMEEKLIQAGAKVVLHKPINLAFLAKSIKELSS